SHRHAHGNKATSGRAVRPTPHQPLARSHASGAARPSEALRASLPVTSIGRSRGAFMKRACALCLAGLIGCSSSSAYVPEEGEQAKLGGRTAAQYQLPSEQNTQADVRIASFGFIEAKPTNR